MNKTTPPLIAFLLISGCNGTPTIQKTIVPIHPFQNLPNKGKATTLVKGKTARITINSPAKKKH
jgi:hypothetical protein